MGSHGGVLSVERVHREPLVGSRADADTPERRAFRDDMIARLRSDGVNIRGDASQVAPFGRMCVDSGRGRGGWMSGADSGEETRCAGYITDEHEGRVQCDADRKRRRA